MKMYLFLLLAPAIFVVGNVLVAVLCVVKFVAKLAEKASHATYKWCNDWHFCSFRHMIDNIIEYYKK